MSNLSPIEAFINERARFKLSDSIIKFNGSSVELFRCKLILIRRNIDCLKKKRNRKVKKLVERTLSNAKRKLSVDLYWRCPLCVMSSHIRCSVNGGLIVHKIYNNNISVTKRTQRGRERA